MFTISTVLAVYSIIVLRNVISERAGFRRGGGCRFEITVNCRLPTTWFFFHYWYETTFIINLTYVIGNVISAKIWLSNRGNGNVVNSQTSLAHPQANCS